MDRPSPGPSLLRRYKWENLTPPEQEAISDALGIAATRGAVGIGGVLTTAAIISNARRGKPPLPALVRYGSLAFFSITSAYIGVLSAGDLYAKRILAVPDSQLAEDLRIVVDDWQARVPAQPVDLQPSENMNGDAASNLGPAPPPHDFSDGPVRRKRANRPSQDERGSKSLTYWLGLTKS